MFLFAVLTGNCLVLIYHYLSPFSEEAVVLIILLEVSKGGFELVKGQFVNYGVISSPEVIFALDLCEKLSAEEEGFFLLGRFHGISVNSIEDGPWSPAGEAHLALF